MSPIDWTVCRDRLSLQNEREDGSSCHLEDSDWRDSDATTMADIYAQLEGTQLKSELEMEEPASS